MSTPRLYVYLSVRTPKDSPLDRYDLAAALREAVRQFEQGENDAAIRATEDSAAPGALLGAFRVHEAKP